VIEVPTWFLQDVSRETLDKLCVYKELLKKWTKKINLISRSTYDHIADRHIWDSAQIFEHIEGRWVDLGSGGGLPGVVLAILADGKKKPLNIVLIESDIRKATFLRTCSTKLEVPLKVISQRIDCIEPLNAEIISARALTNLNNLVELAEMHLTPGGASLFMKGAKWQQELEEARRNWQFSCDVKPSLTNPDAAILRIKDIRRVGL
jgi:16S rRNA (guanine527-N7)-methyltransferase